MTLRLLKGTDHDEAESVRVHLDAARRAAQRPTSNKLLQAKRWIKVMRLQYRLNEIEQQKGLR